jgi:hypothetical protein
MPPNDERASSRVYSSSCQGRRTAAARAPAASATPEAVHTGSRLPLNTRPAYRLPAGGKNERSEEAVSRILYPSPGGVHSSWPWVAPRLQRPTREPPPPRRVAGVGGPRLPYLALLRMGFTVPSPSPGKRCALTAPFHPYPRIDPGAVCSLWHFPSRCRGRALPGMLPTRSPDFPPPAATGGERPPPPITSSIQERRAFPNTSRCRGRRRTDARPAGAHGPRGEPAPGTVVSRRRREAGWRRRGGHAILDRA